jgi:hypothetical protein
MSHKTYDTVLAKRDGQTQQQRFPEWLHPAKAPVDDRSRRELLEYIFKIAKEVKYFDHTAGGVNVASGNWQQILNYTEVDFDQLYARLEELQRTRSMPAHFSLLLTFLELYKEPQRLMNTVTGRHLDFYYHEVLGLKKNDPVPDRAHVIFELKKNTAPYLLQQDTRLVAGKDKLKKELLYKLTHDIVVNNSKVDQLRSLFVNPVNKDLLHFATVANSADGLGAELDKNNPKWNAFGHDKLSLAQVGFCLASDVLSMQEGERAVTVKLELTGISAQLKDNSTLSNLLLVSMTGAKGWTDVKSISPVIDKTNFISGELSFTVALTADDPAIVPYNSEIHGAGYATNKPVMKILFNSSAEEGYGRFRNGTLVSATMTVAVKGMTSLQLENDYGVLNPKKPFQAFGPTPEHGANFWIGSPEIFGKQLTKLQLNIEWKNVPASNLGTHYTGYFPPVNNSSFTANATFSDASGWNVVNDTNALFDATDATKKDENNVSKKIVFTRFERAIVRPKIVLPTYQPPVLKRSSGKTWTQDLYDKWNIMLPVVPKFSWAPVTNVPLIKTFTPVTILPILPLFWFVPEANASLRKGFLHLSLNRSFMFRQYREVFTKQVLDISKGDAATKDLVKEPFAPEMQTLTVDYNATTGKVVFNESTLDDYVNTEIEFYHVGPFGQMREHAYARAQTGFLNNNSVRLLPQYASEGNFYIGLSGLRANDSACLLFQVAEGSADPDLPKVDLQWNVLCDNYWKPLNNLDFIFDTTNDFLASGVVKLVIPREATTSNTMMPDGLLWLQVSIGQHAGAVCLMSDVKANAAIAEFEDNDNDPAHLENPLPASTISKLQQPAGAIKSVTQPYASFGGRMQENNKGFYTRVSERLRHKERAVACWDYERLILQHFPNIYKVKCINHSSPESFTAAGHTLVVVVPDLTNQNAINPFQPRVDKNTLDLVLQFLQKHATGWAEHHVVNPLYEPVKITVSVQLKVGYEFNYYQGEINKVLQQFLSPWITGGTTDIRFGGKVTESHIVKLLEDLGYVDYITDLKLYHSTDGGTSFTLRKQFIETTGPASILVSHTDHTVNQS